MEQQRGARPGAGAPAVLVIPLIQFFPPGVKRIVEPVRRDGDEVVKCRHDALRLVSAENIHRQKLQKIKRPQRRRRRHHLFAVPLGMQREAVVVIVAELVNLEIVPAKKRENPQKRLVQRFRPEDGAMAQLVMRRGEE